ARGSRPAAAGRAAWRRGRSRTRTPSASPSWRLRSAASIPASTATLPPRASLGSVPARNRLVERVPGVLLMDHPAELADQRSAVVAVGHDGGAIAVPDMSDQLAL